MILEKETYEKFGYYPGDLGTKSHKRVLAACDDCGKIREITKSAYRSLCISCIRKGKHIGKDNPNWKGGKIKCICKYCGGKFKKYPSEIKLGGGKFCSAKCSYKYRTGKNNPLRNKVKRICKKCGKEFEAHPSVIKNGGGIFCSPSCKRKAQKIPKHHTKPELIFEQICKNNNLPFKYTGDGSFWIHNINPDFIECNGKKIAVEIFGDYWHSPLLNYKLKEDRTLPYRKKVLKKYGWELVVFWGTDLLRADAEQFVLLQLRKG